MDLLCVLTAVVVLFFFCAALTLKARVPAALAPLTALSIVVAVLTLAGMAGVLYPAAWALYLLGVVACVGAFWPRKGRKPDWKALFTPGSMFFWGMTVVFAVYFSIRQPMATGFDELNLWATAVKVTKVDNSLYATATLGTPWAVTQNPGLPLLSYFFQFLGSYADWKIYLAYDALYFACFAAVLGRWPPCCGAPPSSLPSTTTRSIWPIPT